MSEPYTPQVAPPNVRFTRLLAFASLIGLIVLGLAWELWLAPLRPGSYWWAVKVLPLFIPLVGIMRYRMYTYRWVSLFIWFYFIEGVMRAWGDKGLSAYLAFAEVLLCVSLFVACALHVRLRFKSARAIRADI